MTNTAQYHLKYLHDAICHTLTWYSNKTEGRDIRLCLTISKDAGYPPWNGKEIVIELRDVIAARFTGWGYQIGKDILNCYQPGISSELEAECLNLTHLGITVPSQQFTLSFHTGTSLEVVCSEVVSSV
jgi:hypothetical protein